MAIDSAAKRKSIAAISLICVGPVVVPDGAIGLFDRQVVGYGYGGIATAAQATAGHVCIQSATLSVARATGTVTAGYTTGTLSVARATGTISC